MTKILPVRPRNGSRQNRSVRRRSRAMGVLHGPRRLFCRKEPATTARTRREEDRACRRAGLPRSERLRPPGSWRAVRRPPVEETTPRARPEQARFPTLCVLTTSAAFYGGRRALYSGLLTPYRWRPGAGRSLFGRIRTRY